MAPKLLNQLQVVEIYERHHRGREEFRDLAAEYGVSVQHVRKIASGDVHADITGHQIPHAATCTNCPGRDVAEDNVDRAYAALASFLCWRCHASINLPVSGVLRRRGRVACADCDGRLRR